MSEPRKTFIIHDGPPFATGSPHYGHLLTMTVKDIVTRYKQQQGYHVPRRNGWDTHGLPIEFQIEKKLGLKSKQDVETYGIPEYCDQCRSIVLDCVDEWHDTYQRMQCVFDDLSNPYLTMDNSYIQGVWKVLEQLFMKGLVYQGYKVMPYSVGCGTPLSNFEVSLDYRQTRDMSAMVRFKLLDPDQSLDSVVYALAWTTTPWSLVANQSLCVNPEATYVYQRTSSGSGSFIQVVVYEKADPDLPIIKSVKGQDIVGMEYEPLFSFQVQDQGHGSVFKILGDSYVGVDVGTGIVHQAPMFGEDDYRVCLREGVINERTRFVIPYDDNGYLTSELSEFFGIPDHLPELRFFTKVNKFVLKRLKYPYETKEVVHNYPHCWRSGKPLMYRAVSSWFVDVNAIRSDMLDVISQINWVPSYVGSKRIYNWVKDGTQNWCFSRNRYWGAPVPIWRNSAGETVVASSIQDLVDKGATLDGVPIQPDQDLDLHRPTVDKIVIPSLTGGEPLTRTSEVFDCWFESGSMPWASCAPDSCADFIAEGLDQTRGWFYTLLVLSTALTGKPAFKNVIVTGIIQAEDGQKMSKSKGNYRPIKEVLDKYGPDAVRMYLSQTRATCAEETRVDYSMLKQIKQTVTIPLNNIVQLLTVWQQGESPSIETEEPGMKLLSQWILDETYTCLKQYHQDMNAYKLWNVMERITALIDNLSRKYINLTKDELNIKVVKEVMYYITYMLSPFAPGLSSTISSKLGLTERQPQPQPQPQPQLYQVDTTKRAITDLFVYLDALKNYRESVRNIEPVGVCLGYKYPIYRVCVPKSLPESLYRFIKSDCGVYQVDHLTDDQSQNALTFKTMVVLNPKSAGPKLGPKMKDVMRYLKSNQPDMTELQSMGLVENVDYTVTRKTILTKPASVFNAQDTTEWLLTANEQLLIIHVKTTEQLDQMYYDRMIHATIAKLRKQRHLKPADEIQVYAYALEVLDSSPDKCTVVPAAHVRVVNTPPGDDCNALECLGYQMWLES